MSPAVHERLSSQLAENGSEFALAQDCVKAIMRVVTDPSVNGRLPMYTSNPTY